MLGKLLSISTHSDLMLFGKALIVVALGTSNKVCFIVLGLVSFLPDDSEHFFMEEGGEHAAFLMVLYSNVH